MYGWGGGRPKRPQGTADADNATAETTERRRQSDIAFLAWVKTATEEDLVVAQRDEVVGWRLVAIQRRLAMARAT